MYVIYVAFVAIIIMFLIFSNLNTNLNKDLTGKAISQNENPDFDKYSLCFMDCWTDFKEKHYDFDLFEICNCNCKNRYNLEMSNFCKIITQE